MSSLNLNINVHHVTRVEGHGNIVVNMKDGVLEKCNLEIVEPPRYFEAMLRGRNWREAHIITSRICGICSIGHVTASVNATEEALGLELSEQDSLLRKLILHGETLQSHILHVYFLVAPDLLKAPSVFPLVATHKDVVVRALRMKGNANMMCDLLAGRTIHPISVVPGGYTILPSKDTLLRIKKMFADEMVPDALATLETLKALAPAIPDFTRETEYIGLRDENDAEYEFYKGDIVSTDTGRTSHRNYLKMTNEYCVEYSTSKRCKANRGSLMVGALARFNINHDLLHPLAAKMAGALGLKAPCYNPFMNSVAQFVECVHVVEDSLIIIDKLLEMGIDQKPAPVDIDFHGGGNGVSAVEVPRGILYHEYTYNNKGQITEANCIIPTGQNIQNIEDDMRKIVPELAAAGKSEEEITFILEMLVRAYDPCISCSVHLLDVKFIK
jgi:coenzyme F420-reducing hydrogenase alpha subunit